MVQGSEGFKVLFLKGHIKGAVVVGRPYQRGSLLMVPGSTDMVQKGQGTCWDKMPVGRDGGGHAERLKLGLHVVGKTVPEN